MTIYFLDLYVKNIKVYINSFFASFVSLCGTRVELNNLLLNIIYYYPLEDLWGGTWK